MSTGHCAKRKNQRNVERGNVFNSKVNQQLFLSKNWPKKDQI